MFPGNCTSSVAVIIVYRFSGWAILVHLFHYIYFLSDFFEHFCVLHAQQWCVVIYLWMGWSVDSPFRNCVREIPIIKYGEILIQCKLYGSGCLLGVWVSCIVWYVIYSAYLRILGHKWIFKITKMFVDWVLRCFWCPMLHFTVSCWDYILVYFASKKAAFICWFCICINLGTRKMLFDSICFHLMVKCYFHDLI